MNTFSFLKNIDFSLLKEGNFKHFNNIYQQYQEVGTGDIFVAIKGQNFDGHAFIGKAYELGAKLVLVTEELEDIKTLNEEHFDTFMKDSDFSIVKVKELRANLGDIASTFYDFPQTKLTCIGITGTNGKTTSAQILAYLLGFENSLVIGTISNNLGGEIIPSKNTTPESVDLIRLCFLAVKKGLKYLIMEVSSHALELGRVDTLAFDYAIFTNLTSDHLDFHKTTENYFKAKRKLFLKLKNKKNSVFNSDDEYGLKLQKEFGGYGFSLDENSDLNGKILEFRGGYQLTELNLARDKYQFKTKLLGKYNLQNILGVLITCKMVGVDVGDCIHKLEKFAGVPGRLEAVDSGQDFEVLVDYAHTADGLINVLSELKSIAKGRLITIFGCGGDRDTTKRKPMGEAAKKYSDYVIITSDNPRTEDPQKIVEDVEQAFLSDNGATNHKNYEVILDRKKAISRGVAIAKTNDILLIAGKGHETYQIIGQETIDFDDRLIAKEALEK